MSSEVTISSEEKQIETTNYKSNRKIYNREEFFRYYYCTKETPEYLKEFQYLYNNFTEDNWCKKPIPKFEVPEAKSKPVYTNKLKARQRTLSNQSGDNPVDFPENYSKQRSYTSSNGKSNRYGTSPNEMRSTEDIKTEANNAFINTDDFVDNNEAQWHKVEPRAIRTFNSSKPYAQNIQLTENHWKKWTKDTNQIGDKNRTQSTTVNRQERNNNIWIRKNDSDTRQKNTRSYGRHSVSKSGDQTEDIWQDDWDTELKSEIAKDTDDLMLDSYEFPKSSVLPVTPPPMESEQKGPIFDKPIESSNPRFDLWYYRDLTDIERGPFSSENMANWLATGYFNPSTFVRRSCDERFLLLAEYRALYGRIPFTAGPTIPPIHINTPIEIDVKQLLIGVEMNLIQKVISCATTLPIAQSPILHNNSMRIDESIQIASNATEIMAILEEKRMLEESRLELERERERMIQEQEQWRLRMEAEFKAKMEEIILEKSLISSTNVENPDDTIEFKVPLELPVKIENPVTKSQPVVENVEEHNESEILIPTEMNIKSSTSVEKWEVDIDQRLQVLSNAENNLWFSKKDIKRQKQTKKSKFQENKSTKEEKEILQIAEAKHPDQPTDSRISFISKETMNLAKKENVENKGRPIKIELDIPKNDSTVIRNVLPNSNNSVSQAPTKSLLDIQAEEFEKERIEKESKILDEIEIKAKSVKIEPAIIRKNDLPSSWIQSQPFPSSNLPMMTKSLIEIQAEESAKEKRQQELQNVAMAHTIETNKVSVKPVKIEPVNRKNDMPSSWIQSPSFPSSNLPTATKSLLEIQAEESAKEKRQQELQNVAMAHTIDTNKVSSFKESLLKSAKLPKQPIISGKSIWDMIPTETPTSKPVQTPEPAVKKNIEVKSSKVDVKGPPAKKTDIESDQLTDWCVKKLVKFSDKFDVQTVIELLKQVPNEEVMELALQLLDDSKFTSNFVVEFINKRQEISDRQTEDSWHTVKKPITTTPVNTTAPKSKSSKSKSKKKMVVVDTKFR